MGVEGGGGVRVGGWEGGGAYTRFTGSQPSPSVSIVETCERDLIPA